MSPGSILFALLIAAAVFPPFVGIAGPLSLDDLFPLLAVTAALAVSVHRRRWPPLDATAIGFVLLMLAGIASSAVHAETMGDLIRLTAKSAGRTAFYLVLVAETRAVVTDPKRALWIVVGAATLEAGFALASYLLEYRGPYGMGVADFGTTSALSGRLRAQGTFGAELGPFQVEVYSANFLAAYLMMTTLLTTALFLASEKLWAKLLLLLTGAMQLAALFLTYTRASLLALAGGVLALGWLMDRKKLALGALIAGTIAAVGIPTVRGKLFDRHDRLGLWWAAARITADHPLAGIGEGNHENVVFSDQDYMDTPFGVASSTAHNSVLQSAVHHGVFGGLAHLLLYLLAGMVTVRAVNRARGRERILAAGIGAALFGYLCQDQFNNLMYVPKVATQAWFLFGLLLPPEE